MILLDSSKRGRAAIFAFWVVGASLLLHWSTVLCWAGRVVCSSFFWTAENTMQNVSVREGNMCLLQSWHKTGFGNQARMNRHTFPSTGAKRRMKQPVSVCQIANHHHLPTPSSIWPSSNCTRFYGCLKVHEWTVCWWLLIRKNTNIKPRTNYSA